MADPREAGGPRVALVHDWLTGMRGGEKVLEVLAEIFPAADLFTLVHARGSVSATIEARRIRTSWLQKLPSVERRYRWALPLFPAAIERFDLSGYDLILSSSHCVAKGARPAPRALSVCYCHTPMRYVWERFDDYFGGWRGPRRWFVDRAAVRLRRWDVATAPRVRLWIANSGSVRGRIVDHYGVAPGDVEVIAPPVDTALFRPGAGGAPPPPGLEHLGYDLVVSAFVPYKRLDLAVLAARRTGRRLVLAGKGPDETRLRQLAATTPGKGEVIFVGAPLSADLPALYAHCRAFVFPGLEDFGITPLEATACGRPVVAYGAGGVLDTVVPGLNGVFFAEQTEAALAEALADPRLDRPWDTERMVAHAARFGRERFRAAMAERLDLAWRRHRGGEARV
jgi:glycosyltransferase involved in cell wall biosynthesis